MRVKVYKKCAKHMTHIGQYGWTQLIKVDTKTQTRCFKNQHHMTFVLQKEHVPPTAPATMKYALNKDELAKRKSA